MRIEQKNSKSLFSLTLEIDMDKKIAKILLQYVKKDPDLITIDPDPNMRVSRPELKDLLQKYSQTEISNCACFLVEGGYINSSPPPYKNAWGYVCSIRGITPEGIYSLENGDWD